MKFACFTIQITPIINKMLSIRNIYNLGEYFIYGFMSCNKVEKIRGLFDASSLKTAISAKFLTLPDLSYRFQDFEIYLFFALFQTIHEGHNNYKKNEED